MAYKKEVKEEVKPVVKEIKVEVKKENTNVIIPSEPMIKE